MAAVFSGWVVCFLCWAIVSANASTGKQSLDGTIIFSTYRRLRFAFDIFCVEVPSGFANSSFSETRLTYGEGSNVNHNGFFTNNADQNLIFKESSHDQKHGSSRYDGDPPKKHGSSGYADPPQGRGSLDGKILAYISELRGRPQIFFNLYSSEGMVSEKNGTTEMDHSMVWHKVETTSLHAVIRSPIYDGYHRMGVRDGDSDGHKLGFLRDGPSYIDDNDGDDVHQPVFLQDRPSIARGSVFYVSSQERPKELRQSWTAVYSTSFMTGLTTRLTPVGVVDYSPSVSPSGNWVIVASYGNRTWDGEVHELYTDLYIFDARDGSARTLLVNGGGWPSWADDSTFFFHRKADDGWWSIYKAMVSLDMLLAHGAQVNDVVTIERVTPPGIHCFTPAASATGKWVAVATRRTNSSFRHIEIFDLQTYSFSPVTSLIAPTTHHYNPFVSHDSTLLGYHKCRKLSTEDTLSIPERILDLKGSLWEATTASMKENAVPHRVARLDSVVSPSPSLSLLRTDGEFPSFSPDGSFIAYIRKAGETGVRAMRSDGSRSVEVYANSSFGTVWDRVRDGVVYTSSGPIFHSRASVHVVAIHNVDKLVNGDNLPLKSKVLTKEGTRNNAFPSPSPDGKYLVFRSSRSGSKNLYIMDATQGEEGGLWRLTQGRWTDTMCSWSPDGQWIVFSSDREDPGSGSFSLYLIHPNGTGLRKVFKDHYVVGGRTNHASFSPDSKSLLFATDYAGLSSEPIGLPFQYQGYGDIFVSSLDGKRLERMTHVQYENGTPFWGAKYIKSSEVTQEGEDVQCAFDDVDWLTGDGFIAQLQVQLNSPIQARCGNAG